MADILIIDDEDATRNSMRKTLEQAGHIVREAASGREGLSLIHNEMPDLLITDIFMPDKDGLEVIRELRQEKLDLRILVISDGGITGDIDLLPQAKALGAQATLRKPFHPEDLLEVVNMVLRS
ncbi:MAG: response regulator [Candidatus Latescibacteria bacterium]|jgi:CheY-like chemotaxis protein|nr:response regulator [Candidatus Latescibacterota bacterium]MBT5832117.1 response regulator [Candidatus Latescibacterota bacterium]